MEDVVLHAPEADRTRANTWADVNRRIDRKSQLVVGWAASSGSTDEISQRLALLDHEWNLDRVLEAEAAITGLAGVALAFTRGKAFFALPAFVSSMLVLHAVHGWYPLLPLLRRLEFRTQDEIDRERFALKAVRGDFFGVPRRGTDEAERAAAAWAAVCA